jgi:solute carrier family 23 (nucleobase transporter), member 1
MTYLQHYLTMIGAIVAIPFILCPALCMQETDPDRSNIISTMIFVTGKCTSNLRTVSLKRLNVAILNMKIL